MSIVLKVIQCSMCQAEQLKEPPSLNTLDRFGKSTHISMISNSVTHLRSYTNSAIADIAGNSAPISPVTARDRRCRRIKRRRLRIKLRFHLIEWPPRDRWRRCSKRRRLHIERRRLRIKRRYRRIEWRLFECFMISHDILLVVHDVLLLVHDVLRCITMFYMFLDVLLCLTMFYNV